ncbi:peptidoglycan DD-metalloendopeptidase family protein [Syntrophomonas zehnderi]|uniref:peptidoglycan DD-metalloendopeptidase family protein n=1 Tax=Syntrophomonas zehnderi TaxID=404335 RepID=UPI0018DE83C0|nr:peptidoglycan DD-metalloendopeptidase family protein [Syntrophomonas zehnderi]
MFVFLLGIWCLGVKTPAYAVFINGQKKFIVKDARTVDKALDEITKKQVGGRKNVELSSKVNLKRTFVKRDSLMAATQVEAELKKNLQFKMAAAAIVVNGKPIAYVNNEATAKKLLDKIKDENSQVEEGEKLITAKFVEKVQIEPTQVAIARVLSSKGAWNLITTGTACPEKYTIKEGDSLWSIARQHDMYVADILKANQLQEDDILDLDQEIVLIKCKPYINVVAKIEGSKTEAIPYQTKVITDRGASNSVNIKNQGADGEKQIAYVLSKRNGVIENREILSEKIIKQPTDRVVVKGTRVVNVASRGGSLGSGRLSWPAHGSISQYFSGRHSGIDIAGSAGSAVRAADSGTVVFAGRQGGYGNFIIINHGNGLVTRYAHCSSLNVSAGQSVASGQTIGTRGSTGRSTGPHLHFEVLANGRFVNPLNYLR